MKNKLFIGLLVLIMAAVSCGAAFAQEDYTFSLSEASSFSDKTENWSIDVSVPEISGMAYGTDEAELNAYFASEGLVRKFPQEPGKAKSTGQPFLPKRSRSRQDLPLAQVGEG